MIVHFISTKTDLKENIPYLRQISKVIQDRGHTLAREWLEPAYEHLVLGKSQPPQWPLVFDENVEAINKADVLIAEITHKSFGVGYQVAMATQQKKPVLLLQRKEVSKESFANGLSAEGVQYKAYSEENVNDIIEAFLEENDITAKDMRFNFFIDRPIYNYLRWAASKTGKTKAEILRELVSREIDQDGYKRKGE